MTLHVANATEIHLVIRLPVPARQRSTIEQEILHEALSNIDYSKAKPASSGSIPADQTAVKE